MEAKITELEQIHKNNSKNDERIAKPQTTRFTQNGRISKENKSCQIKPF